MKSKRTTAGFLAGAGLFALLANVSANAVTLPPFEISGLVLAETGGLGPSEEKNAAIGTTTSSSPGTLGSAQGQVVLSATPLPAIQSSASATTAPVISAASAQGNGVLTYFLMVEGPSGSVPVTINATGSISGTPIADGNSVAVGKTLFQVWNGGTVVVNDIAEFFVQGAFGGQIVTLSEVGTGTVSGSLASGFTGGFIETGTYPLLANVVYTVVIQALAGASIGGNAGGGAEQAFASVDPTFDVPDGYTLLLSPGVGNGGDTTTPIPAALPLFATGLGALGLFGWRRKRKQAA